MPIAADVLATMRSRTTDPWGSGHFGAPRGNRVHQGLDIVSRPGESVFSPINGILFREAVPYADDPTYKGVVIRGSGQWVGTEIKIFYVEGSLCGQVTSGQEIGRAQDLTRRYPGITNHIHLEVRRGGAPVRPQDLFQRSF